MRAKSEPAGPEAGTPLKRAEQALGAPVRGKSKEAERRVKAIYPTPEFDLLAFIAVVAACERVCVYCGCSDSMGCPEGGSATGTCSWVELHPSSPTGVCSQCVDKSPVSSLQSTVERNVGWPPWVIVRRRSKAVKFLTGPHSWGGLVKAKLFPSLDSALCYLGRAEGTVRQLNPDEVKLVKHPVLYPEHKPNTEVME